MIQDKLTQIWVKITGRKVDIDKDSWINGIIGDEDVIDSKLFGDGKEHKVVAEV